MMPAATGLCMFMQHLHLPASFAGCAAIAMPVNNAAFLTSVCFVVSYHSALQDRRLLKAILGEARSLRSSSKNLQLY